VCVCYADVIAFHFDAAVGGFCLGMLSSNLSSLSALGTRGLYGLRFSATFCRFGLGCFDLGRLGGFRSLLLSLGDLCSLDSRLVRCSCVCNGCRRHYGGVRRGFVVAVVRRASAFKVNLR
jgi:hypothetical protein